MIKSTIEAALNDQINAEFHSAYIYLSMAAYFHDINLDGCANWMHLQYQEEVSHAMKMFDFLNDRGGRIKLTTIAAPDLEWASPQAAFEAAYAHEQYITGRINDLVALAISENDYATHTFLQWFVNEQVEEEASVDAIVQSFKMMEGDKRGLFMMDRELAGRQPETEAGEA